jgi:hypothetical protein
MAKSQPKRTTRLVPPGAVYYFVKADNGNFTANDAKQLWFAALGDRVAEGFGRFVPGIWHPKESGT